MANSTLTYLLKSISDNKGLKEAKKGLIDVKGAAGDLTKGLFGVNLASLASMGGLVGVAVSAKKAVTDLIDYNKEVSDAAGATGMAVDEFSRIVQVADDFGIRMDSVTRSLELATKNGFRPSIDSLADLADRTNAIKNPTQRAAELAKILGRNWAELDPLLRGGGAAMRENAGGISDALIVTREEVEATEKMRLALDELGDTWTGLRNIFALGLITEVNTELEALGILNERLRETGQWGNVGFIEYMMEWRRWIDILNRGEAQARLSEIKNELDGLSGGTTILVDADTAAAEAALKEIAEKTPGTPEYWAALELRLDAKAEDALTSSRLAFLEWLRYHPEMHLTIYERTALATGTSSYTCFVAGTPVRMASGDDRPIEDLLPGNEVEAYSPEAGLRCGATVAEVMCHQADHLNTLGFSSGAVLQVTDEHPFLTPTGWKTVRELDPGATVLAPDGRQVVLETKRREAGPAEVFNLTVSGAHTYIVAGLVVHNKVKQARGGPLGDVALVGEEGPELIVRGVVIPAPETRKLLELGLTPNKAFRMGGEDVEVLGTWPTTPINPDVYGGETLDLNRIVGGTIGWALPTSGIGGTTTAAAASASAASAAAVAAVAQQAAASASAGVASAIPTAISQQMAERDAAAARRQMDLIFEVRELRSTIVRAVREGVQMGQGWSA